MSTDGAGDSIRRQDSEPVVIGGQMAAARAAEARHQAEPHRRSPLAGVAYDPAAGELNLLHLAGTPKDELIDEFVDRFAASSVAERALQRSSLTDARLRVFRLRPEPIVALRAWLDQPQAHWDEQLRAFKRHVEENP